MAVQLNHTIVSAHDKHESARFLAEILGLPAPQPFGFFEVVHVANGVSLDFADVDEGEQVAPQHYAFLISEAEFDSVYARVVDRGLTIWPEPWRQNEGQINHNDGGRGFYFLDPSGHFLEVLTRPYGSGTPT